MWSEKFWVVTFWGRNVWVVVTSGLSVGGRNVNSPCLLLAKFECIYSNHTSLAAGRFHHDQSFKSSPANPGRQRQGPPISLYLRSAQTETVSKVQYTWVIFFTSGYFHQKRPPSHLIPSLNYFEYKFEFTELFFGIKAQSACWENTWKQFFVKEEQI